MWRILLLAVCFVARSFSKTLPEFYDQVFDPATQELTLSADVFPPEVAGFLHLVLKVIQPAVKNAECVPHFMTSPRYFECAGTLKTVRQTEMAGTIVVAMLSENHFGLLIEANSKTFLLLG